jgi:aminocarboxymuconate-semialdehyde decarboxylase
MSRFNSDENKGLRRRDFLKLGAAASAAAVVSPEKSNAQTTYAESYTGENSYAGKTVPPGTPKPWNVPQLPGPPISIDVHTHWAPQAYMDLKAKFGKPDTSNPANHDMEARIKWMDANGEKMQVLTLGGFMPWQWVTPEQGIQVAQVTNDAALEVTAKYPDRFLAGIELPVNAPDLALKELNRVAGKPGMVAVHLPNSLASREYLFEPAFAPVLAQCNELKVPLLIHPLDGEPNWYAGHRLADEYSGSNQPGLFPGLTNTAGETFEQATTISKLIVNGTLDKYPDLDIIVAHSGGAFPFIASRIDWRGADGGLQHPFLSYARRFYYDSLTFYPLALEYLIRFAGADRVVVGTDNMGGGAPGGGGGQGQNANANPNRNANGNGNANANANRPHGGPHSVIDQTAISAEDRDLILRGNLIRLFKLQA